MERKKIRRIVIGEYGNKEFKVELPFSPLESLSYGLQENTLNTPPANSHTINLSTSLFISTTPTGIIIFFFHVFILFLSGKYNKLLVYARFVLKALFGDGNSSPLVLGS